VTSQLVQLPADAEVKADDISSPPANADLGPREASTAPSPIPDAGQPGAIEVDTAPPLDLPHDDVAAHALPDPHTPALDDVTQPVLENHPQLSLPTATPEFGFGPMHVDAPIRSTLTQPVFGFADSDQAATPARDLDSSLRFSLPPSTPTPSLGGGWSFNFTDSTMGYQDMAADVYANPMAQYAGNQPAYCMYSYIATFRSSHSLCCSISYWAWTPGLYDKLIDGLGRLCVNPFIGVAQPGPAGTQHV
jgi:hypothetical protein